MIKPLLIAAMVAASTVHAGVNDLRTCERIGEIAMDTFSARHLNIPADKVFRKYQGNRFSMAIVHDAYTQPRWYEAERILEERVEFKSRWVLWCMGTDEVIK